MKAVACPCGESKLKGDFPEEVKALCVGLTSKSLLQLISVCDELVESIDRNCNNNLLVVRMCYEFKRAIGR